MHHLFISSFSEKKEKEKKSMLKAPINYKLHSALRTLAGEKYAS
jgi:hypothetical protein